MKLFTDRPIGYNASVKVPISQFKALLYADIFGYPLTKSELGKYEVRSTKKKVRSKKYDVRKKSFSQRITYLDGFYCLKGRERLVKIRKERETYSREKLAFAKKAATLLQIIPSIQMIAITGALAMNNATVDDDIDVLIVTSRNRVWLARFLSIMLLELFGLRRRPKDTSWNNKICLNMFLDEDHLAVPVDERDIFSAHEVAQLKVLWSRGEIEKTWWRENEWVKRFLPKALEIEKLRNKEIKGMPNYLVAQLLNYFEELSKKLQISYMQSKRTSEVIGTGYLRFHPHDAREWVMREYGKRLRRYGLE